MRGHATKQPIIALSAQGYRTLEASALQEAFALLTSHNPELVLLDLGLPDGEGLTWLARVREWSQVPIIIVSARGREADQIAALDTGADDYLTKPFGVGELLARLRVALRHARARASGGAPPVVEVGPLRIDLARVWPTGVGSSCISRRSSGASWGYSPCTSARS